MMMWFNRDDWCGKEIDCETATWVLDQKLDEKSSQRTKERSIPPHDPCFAWAVFSCKRKDGQGEKCAVKIWIQIPYTGTELESAQSRRAQAQGGFPSSCMETAKALCLLRDNKSEHSPSYITIIETRQGDNGLVPAGFLIYTFMTWCPGVPLLAKDYNSKPKEERDTIRHAFKEAWDDARRCGVVNKSPSEGDLLWDAPNKKCHLVDFKEWSPPIPSDIDPKYEDWGLVELIDY